MRNKLARRLSFSLLFLSLFALLALSPNPDTSLASSYKPSGTAPDGSSQPSKVDQRILRAQQSIAKFPQSVDGYNQLASAYMQKARETVDFSFNENADAAITRALSVEPDNYDALKLRTKLQLTYHRFAEALDTTRRMQTVRDDDHALKISQS